MGGFDGARIYFSPCGIGLGHVGRTLSVAEAAERLGAEVMFSTYLDGVEFVRQRGFPVVSAPALSLESDSTGRVDLRASVVSQGLTGMYRFMQQVTAEMEYMKAFRPDVVFSDTRLSTVIAGKILGLPVALMLNQFLPMVPRTEHNLMLSKVFDGGVMTLLGRSWAASDVILIPDFPEPYTLSVASLRIPKPHRHLVRMVGFVLPRRPEEVEDTGRVRREASALEGDRLIYAAISGPDRERKPLIRLLRPIFEEFPEGYKVMMSLGIPNGGSEPATSGSLTVIPWVRDRFEYLKACDLLVCRGGHNTIMQGICYGKPPIIIPTPNHTEQYGNARRAKELGVAEVLLQDDVSAEKILGLADGMLSDPRYQERLQEFRSRGFVEGLENTIGAITELMKR